MAETDGLPFAAWLLTLDGRDLTDTIAPRLISLTLTERRGDDADQLELQVHDHDGKLDIPPEGAELELSLGWARGVGVKVGLKDKGKFKVDEVSWGGPPDKLTIRARSADFTDSFRVRREKKRKGTTLGEVLKEIAGDNGLEAIVAPELAGVTVPVLAQDQRSDAAMLRFLGRRYDAVATVKAGRLLFSPIGKGTTASGKELPTFSITRQSGDTCTWSRAAREEFSGVEARWHDKSKGQRETVKAGGEGDQAKGKPKRLRRTFHTEADAKAAAEAENKRVKRAGAKFELTLGLGDAELFPELKGSVAGFKPAIDGTAWLIAEVTHTLDGDAGFRTRLQLEKDA